MSNNKDTHSFLENGGLPGLVIIAVPVGILLLANWPVWFGASTPVTPTQTQTQPQALPAVALSLDSSSTLPSSVAAGAFVPFSFTIRNLQRSDAYQYKVSVQWSTGEEDVIDENVLSLSAGASKTISEDLKFEVANETAQISIELPQTGQTLTFAIPKTK